MESATFDQLTARLTTRLSRRHSLALLGSLGIASTARTEGVAGKKRRRRNKPTRCVTNEDCSNFCRCEDGGDSNRCVENVGVEAPDGFCENCPKGTVLCQLVGETHVCFAACRSK